MKEKLVEIIKARYPEATVVLEDVTKENGTVHAGCCIRMKDTAVSPMIYYDAGALTEETVNDIADEICNSYEQNKNPFVMQDFKECMTKEYVSANVLPMVLGHDANANMVTDKKLVHDDILDLVVLYYVPLSIGVMNGNASFKLSEDHLTALDMTHDDIVKCATENLRKIVHKSSLSAVLIEFMGQKECDDFEIDESMLPKDDPIKFYSVNDRYRGAAVLLLSDLFEKGTYILPSSVHEVLAISEEDVDGMSISDLKAMVTEVNITSVADDEILSEHVYYYDGEKITIAA